MNSRIDAPQTDEQMNSNHNEQLSALADGELDSSSARFLLRRLAAEPALAGAWTRYQIIGTCLRRSEWRMLPASFAVDIQQALADDATPKRGMSIVRWGGGFAVAATVTLLALIVAKPVGVESALQPKNAGEQALVAGVPMNTGAVAESSVRESDLRPDFGSLPAQTVAVTQGRNLGPAVYTDPRIESYLVRHNLALQANGRNAPLSYVRVLANSATAQTAAASVTPTTQPQQSPAEAR